MEIVSIFIERIFMPEFEGVQQDPTNSQEEFQVMEGGSALSELEINAVRTAKSAVEKDPGDQKNIKKAFDALKSAEVRGGVGFVVQPHEMA